MKICNVYSVNLFQIEFVAFLGWLDLEYAKPAVDPPHEIAGVENVNADKMNETYAGLALTSSISTLLDLFKL